MEETTTNLHLEVNELHHRDMSTNQSVCKDIKEVAVTTEEITENPECLVLRRSSTIKTVKNEEVVIPKQDLALRSESTVPCSEGGSTMEIDVSSQESTMDIASQESLPILDPIAEEASNCNDKVSVSLHEAMLAREEAVKKKEHDLLEREGNLKNREQDIVERERNVLQMKTDLEKHQKTLGIHAKQVVDRESTLKKRESVVQIREKAVQFRENAVQMREDVVQVREDGAQLSTFELKITVRSSENNVNSCVPAKRAKKD